MKNCDLHIGTAKTGTTSIQSFLGLNRPLLLARGILYPESLGRLNHEKLVAYALDDQLRDTKRQQIGITTPESLELFRSRLRSELQHEIEVTGDRANRLVVSNEHCHSRLTQISELQRLRDFLGQFCETIRVIAYLRRQDLTAISMYHTRLRSGSSSCQVFPPVKPNLPLRYDHLTGLSLYASVFGQENIVVRIFDRQRFKGNDLLTDFWSLIDDGDLSEFRIKPPLNTSLPPASLHFLRMVNLASERVPAPENEDLRAELIRNMMRRARFRPKSLKDIWDYWRLLEPCLAESKHSRANDFRVALIKITSKGRLNSDGIVSRKDAADFFAHFRESNRQVKSLYLPNWNGPLFDENFDHFPENV